MEYVLAGQVVSFLDSLLHALNADPGYLPEEHLNALRKEIRSFQESYATLEQTEEISGSRAALALMESVFRRGTYLNPIDKV